MHVGAIGGLLVRQHETPAGKVTQSRRIGEDLKAGLAVPDDDIAAFGLDDRSAGRVINRTRSASRQARMHSAP